MKSSHSSRLAWLGSAALLWGCAAIPKDTDPASTQIWVSGRSHNRSDVDVYLLCGTRDAQWLGVISQKGTAAFEIPAAAAHCVHGLNFFLVDRSRNRGYWVGPVRPRAGGHVELVVEKYAGLSAARVLGEGSPGGWRAIREGWGQAP